MRLHNSDPFSNCLFKLNQENHFRRTENVQLLAYRSLEFLMASEDYLFLLSSYPHVRHESAAS